MHLLFRLVDATYCRSTHHKLALDSLRYLKHERAGRWRKLFLKHYDLFLTGAKDPDVKFKDFRNHVLHVEDDYWGGACEAARTWYDRTVKALSQRDWQNAVYAAGVLSHYCTDPIQPFHTAQTEAENNIHRAVEWSIARSYDSLRQLADEQNISPKVEMTTGDDWLEDLIRQGAEYAHVYYQTLIDHYDFDRAVKDPAEGFDETTREVVASLLRYAACSFAAVLDRAVADANVRPPWSFISVRTILATFKSPLRRLGGKLHNFRNRRLIKAIHREVTRTGKLEDNLPEDDRTVRDLYAEEVSIKKRKTSRPKGVKRSAKSSHKTADSALRKLSPSTESISPKTLKMPARTITASSGRCHLHLDDDVEAAPSIGPKTARRLAKIGIFTVRDLLELTPEDAAAALRARHIPAETIRDWQDQILLVCQIPGLRSHDAQILVACGYRDVDEVSRASVDRLLEEATEFVRTSAGKRVIRSGKRPDRAEIQSWIVSAQKMQSKRAA